jgi:anti-anti-sigma factor
MATVVYAVLDPETGHLRFASAGHPPPLLAAPGGTATYLEGERCPPVGVASVAPPETVVALEPGATVILYTDGLVEKRGASIDEGMEALRHAVAGHSGGLDSLCDDRILQGLRSEDPADDIAVLAVRLLPVAADGFKLTFPAEAGVLATLRRALRQWLDGLGATPEEVHDLTLACTEAATNVLEHAYGPAGGIVEVEATSTAGRVSVTIRDRGRWRTPRGKDRGRGFLLMHALVDTVDVESSPSGTEVRLLRQLGQPADPPAPDPPVTSTAASATPRPGDLVKVVRFAGDLDLVNARRLEADVMATIGNDALGLVIDLTEARHVDSAGVRLLFQLAARLQQCRQQLGVAVPGQSPIRRVLVLAHVPTCAALTTTVDEAVEHIRSLPD